MSDEASCKRVWTSETMTKERSMKTLIAIVLLLASFVVMTPAQAYDQDALRSMALIAVYDKRCEHLDYINGVDVSAVKILMVPAPDQAVAMLGYMGDWEQQLNATGKAEWCARAKVVVATYIPGGQIK
jgi:hypothetical protein